VLEEPMLLRQQLEGSALPNEFKRAPFISPDWDEILLDVNRTIQVTKGGKVRRNLCGVAHGAGKLMQAAHCMLSGDDMFGELLLLLAHGANSNLNISHWGQPLLLAASSTLQLRKGGKVSEHGTFRCLRVMLSAYCPPLCCPFGDRL
jgi:hypothetical protein